MPKITMSWELPEDQTEFMDSFEGWRWKLLVSDMDEWLRREIKYCDREELQEARDKLNELRERLGLRIWE